MSALCLATRQNRVLAITFAQLDMQANHLCGSAVTATRATIGKQAGVSSAQTLHGHLSLDLFSLLQLLDSLDT